MASRQDDIYVLYATKIRLEEQVKNAYANKKQIDEELLYLSQIENLDEGTIEYINTINERNKKNIEFINIYNSITKYLEQYCVHNFIDDYIDICPDAGMNIRYCIHCYKPETR